MIDRDLKDLIDQSLNETIGEDDLRALEQRLLEDPVSRLYYLKSTNLHASLRRRFSVKQNPENILSFTNHFFTTRRVLLAVAASLVLFFGIFSLWVPSRSVGEVAQVVGAYRDNGVAYEIGEAVERCWRDRGAGAHVHRTKWLCQSEHCRREREEAT